MPCKRFAGGFVEWNLLSFFFFSEFYSLYRILAKNEKKLPIRLRGLQFVSFFFLLLTPLDIERSPTKNFGHFTNPHNPVDEIPKFCYICRMVAILFSFSMSWPKSLTTQTISSVPKPTKSSPKNPKGSSNPAKQNEATSFSSSTPSTQKPFALSTFTVSFTSVQIPQRLGKPLLQTKLTILTETTPTITQRISDSSHSKKTSRTSGKSFFQSLEERDGMKKLQIASGPEIVC